MIMVSKEAEERRLRFQAAKDSAGGLAGLIKQELSKKPKVYFLNDGTIVSISKEQIDLKNGWQVKEFDDEQVAILENNNWNLFYVKTDPLVDNLYSIESRPLESAVVSAENNALLLIESDIKNAECSCLLTPSKFTVILSDCVLAQYNNVDKESATVNGQKVLKFYFTTKNDPHFIIHSEYVSLKKLITTTELTFATLEDLTECSIYTVKAFSSYCRI